MPYSRELTIQSANFISLIPGAHSEELPERYFSCLIGCLWQTDSVPDAIPNHGASSGDDFTWVYHL